MGNIGRLLPEGDWPHSADWNSIWFGLSGLGYVMPVGGRCAPSKTAALEVTVTDGQISVGLPEVHPFNGGGVTLSSNESSPDPRYDLIYLEYDGGSGDVVLKKLEGVPDVHPKQPEIPSLEDHKVVPIAVIYLEAFASEITLLKNSRTVMDPTHEHTAGPGLTLTPHGVMEVNADETTITTEGGTVGLVGGGVGWDDLNITMGDGLEGVDTDSDTVIDTLQVDLKSSGGLDFEAGELKVDPSDFEGDGLEVDENNNLQVTAGDGLQLSNDRVKLDIGDGLVLDGTTPDRILKVDLDDNGGLVFNGGAIEVDPSDFDGPGIGVDENNDLKVKVGDGITLSSDMVTADISTDSGLELIGSSPDKEIAVDLETDGGLAFTATGGNIRVNVSDFAGDGLADDGNNNLEVVASDIAGDGLMDDGNNDLRVDVSDFDGDGLSEDANGDLEVQVSDFDGEGLGADGNNNLEVNAGDGITIVNDRTTVDAGAGLRFDDSENSTPHKPLMIDLLAGGGLEFAGTDGDELAVNPSDIAGNGLKENTNGNLELDDGNGLELYNSKLRVKPSDIAGSGIGSSSTELEIYGGDGIEISGDFVEVDPGDGITSGTSGVHATLGSGLKFDSSDNIELDIMSGGGLETDSNDRLKVKKSDLYEVVLDVESYTSTASGYTIPDSNPVFVLLNLTDDRSTTGEAQRARYYFEEDDSNNMTLWVDNMDGGYDMHYHLVAYKMV